MDGNTVLTVINGPEDNSASVIAVNVVTWALASIAIGLRFWSRRMSKAGLGWDDWLILLTGIISQFQFGIGWWWYSVGGGKYMGAVTIDRLRATLTIVFIVQICWAITISLVRASALALWLRLFTQRWVKYYCWAWRAINIAWAISAIAVIATECHPSWAFFDPLEAPPDACGNIQPPFLALSITSIALDAAVLAVPVVVCWGLQLSAVTRAVLCGMFLTGAFTIVVTVIRIVIQTRTSIAGAQALNVTWVWADLGYWTVAETNIAIVSACLPCLRPVVARLTPAGWSLWSAGSAGSGSGRRRGGDGIRRNDPYKGIGSSAHTISRSNGTASQHEEDEREYGFVMGSRGAAELPAVPSSATYIAAGDAEAGRHGRAGRDQRLRSAGFEDRMADPQVRELSRKRIFVEDDVRVQYA